MALANGVRIVWLDEYIGQDGEYREFKRTFRIALEPVAGVPPDAIDVLICALEENATSILFAHTSDKAIEIIKAHDDKQIIFISSGSLGQQIIPHICNEYPYVYRFYIFCGKIENYVEFGLDYTSCLHMFDHETDLLLRLARDISNDIIKQGQIYLEIKDAKNALKCFEHSSALNMKANKIDTLNGPYLAYLKHLNGDDDEVGLIQQATNMLDQQQRSKKEEESQEYQHK
jgi:hypothetical protein